MNNKICVYAICKNEKSYVDAWLNSMSEADYIVVLDTGSTDGTYELLAADPRVTRVEQQLITPWRFDVARNESLKLCPEDTDIFVCTDLDELFVEGWSVPLREQWDSNIHKHAYYKYAWSHDESGNPMRVMLYDKIHNHEWKWKYPIHEVLVLKEEGDEHSNALDLFNDDRIYLHHWQDKDKERSSYLPLLEIRKRENPQDLHTRVYLVHEYSYNLKFHECISEAQQIMIDFSEQCTTDLVCSLYLYMGDAYRGLEDWNAAIKTYKHAIRINNTYAEPYLACAYVYVNHLQQYREAVKILERCIKDAQQFFVWFSRALPTSEASMYDLLGLSYLMINDVEKSFINYSRALHLDPENATLKHNYNFVAERFYHPCGQKHRNSIVQ